MFEQDKTSEIISFLNSLLIENKNEKFKTLYREAVKELELRSPLLAILYKYKETFDGVE